MQKSPAEIAAIIQRLRSIHIGTPTFKALEANLARLLQVGEDGKPSHEPVRFTAGKETHGVILVNGPGSGKTTDILHAVAKLDALAENPETGVPRHIHVTVSSPATLRSLACQFLEKLGIDRISDRAKVHELWATVRLRFQRMGITLVILDEAQDMFRLTSSSETDSMCRMLKSLMQGDHPVVLLLSGTERLKEITRFDAQVNRRFRKITPPPLDIAADSSKLRAVMDCYARNAGLTLDIRDDDPVRLIYGGRYRLGRCIEISILAVEEALTAGSDMLTSEHFETAWGMEEGCPLTSNVFCVDDFMAIELEDDDEIGDRMLEARARRASAVPKSQRNKKVACS